MRSYLTGLDLQRYRPTVIVVEATLPATRVKEFAFGMGRSFAGSGLFGGAF